MPDKDLLTYLETLVTDNRKQLFKTVLENRTRHFTVVLEDLYHKHNTSAIVRTCDIFGVQDLHVIENEYYNFLSKKVTRGSNKWLDFHKYSGESNNTQDCIESLRDKGYQIIVTSPHYNANMLQDFDITKKSAFVFGVEKMGVSDQMMKEADGFLKIPMVGFTESLNVSVAAAIILQSVTEKLRKSTVNWQLTAEEKQEKYAEWIQKSIKSIDKIKERYYTNKNC